MVANDPRGVANLDPMGRIYVGDHLTSLLLALGLMVSEKKIF